MVDKTKRAIMQTTAATGDLSIYTVDDIARRWKTSAWFVRQQIRDGMLKASRVGRLIRVRHADLECYEESWPCTS
jgi:excisionase family DNA binding protein